MSKAGISIIVPIYNAEKYLEQCLDSIVSQKYSDKEVILIDDGSTDNSLSICYQYAEKYPYINVYHFENAGLVRARKRGVELATKEYIGFVDSDDWIEPDMYTEMMQLLCETNSDVIASGIICEYENGTKEINLGSIEAGIYNKEKIESFLSKMIYDEEIMFPGLSPALWNKIFKRKWLEGIYEEIDDRLTLGEDAIVTYPLICKATQIYIMNKAYYHYRIHMQSMAHTYNINTFEKILRFEKNFKCIMECRNLLEKYNYAIDRYSFIFLRNAIKKVYNIDAEMESIKYAFPFERFEKGCKLVIYGFGKVGKSYWSYLSNSNYIDLIGVADKNYKNYCFYDVNIFSPDKLGEMKCDYILIALENEIIAREVKEMMIDMGVESEKILWFKPKRITN